MTLALERARKGRRRNIKGSYAASRLIKGGYFLLPHPHARKKEGGVEETKSGDKIIHAYGDQIVIETMQYKCTPRFQLKIELMKSLQMDLFVTIATDDGRDKTETMLCLKSRP